MLSGKIALRSFDPDVFVFWGTVLLCAVAVLV
jgi:hypothetical protein